jgi:hypothetical protein
MKTDLYAVAIIAKVSHVNSRWLTPDRTWSINSERAWLMTPAEAAREAADAALRIQRVLDDEYAGYGLTLRNWTMPERVLMRVGVEVPDPIPSRDEYREALLHMEEHGGGFARALAQAAFAADGTNWGKLYTAFRDLLDEQRRVAERMAQQP